MNRVSKFGRLVCGVIIFSPLVASCANNVDDKKEEVAAYEVVGGGLAVDSTENAEYGFSIGPLTLSHVENEGPRHKETYAERRKRNNDKKPKNEARKKEVSIAFIQKMRKQKAAGQKIEIAKKFKEEGFDSALLRKCGAKKCHGKDLKIALDLFFNGKTEGSIDFIKSIKENFRGPLYIEEPGMKAFRGADGITILPAVDSETWEDKSNVTITHLFDNTYLFVFTYYHQYDLRNDVFRKWDVIVTMNKNGTIDYDYDSLYIVQS